MPDPQRDEAAARTTAGALGHCHRVARIRAGEAESANTAESALGRACQVGGRPQRAKRSARARAADENLPATPTGAVSAAINAGYEAMHVDERFVSKAENDGHKLGSSGGAAAAAQLHLTGAYRGKRSTVKGRSESGPFSAAGT
jgi:hypothetical protein